MWSIFYPLTATQVATSKKELSCNNLLAKVDLNLA